MEEPRLSRVEKDLEGVFRRIKRRAEDHSSLKQVSCELGKASSYLGNLISENGNLSVPTTLKIAEILNVPPTDFFARPQAPLLPEQQLHLEREEAVLPANPFLDELEPRLVALLEIEVAAAAPVSSNRPLLDLLEYERFRNRAGAKEQAEVLALQWVKELEATAPAPLPGRRLAELAAALALWATIQRTYGFRDLAVKALMQAFPLARRSRDAWALGITYQRASFVLRDLDRPDLTLEFLNEALWQFDAIDAKAERWRCFVDRGTHLSSLHDFDRSQAAYKVALQHLSSDDWRNRAGAFQGLAYVFQEKRLYHDALEMTERGLKECQEEGLVMGFLKWQQGAALFELQQPIRSRACFREALGLVGQYASAGDLALVALDYAEVLQRAGLYSECFTLVADVTRWLPELRSNPILHRILMDFLDLVRLGKLNLAKIESTRTKVKTLAKGRAIERNPVSR